MSLSDATHQRIASLVASDRVVLIMKGTPAQPQCGFSAKVVNVLSQLRTTYTSYDLVEFGKPLVARERPMPEPSGTQVLLRVRRSGVCHSDLHIAEGFFDLGQGGRIRGLDVETRFSLEQRH